MNPGHMTVEALLQTTPTVATGLVRSKVDDRGVYEVHIPSIPATVGARAARSLASTTDGDAFDLEHGTEVVVVFPDGSLDFGVIIGAVPTARRPVPPLSGGRTFQNADGVVVRRTAQADVSAVVREDFIDDLDARLQSLSQFLTTPPVLVAPDPTPAGVTALLNTFRSGLAAEVAALRATIASSAATQRSRSLKVE